MAGKELNPLKQVEEALEACDECLCTTTQINGVMHVGDPVMACKAQSKISQALCTLRELQKNKVLVDMCVLNRIPICPQVLLGQPPHDCKECLLTQNGITSGRCWKAYLAQFDGESK